MISNKFQLTYRKVLIELRRIQFIVPDFFKYQFIRSKSPDKFTIVFVGTILHGRISRIAKWLSRTTDFELILICSNAGFSKKFVNPSFKEVKTYRNKWHLKSVLKKFEGSQTIFHIFGPPYEAAEIVISSNKKSKTLYDYQDLLVTNFGLNPPFKYMQRDMKREKFVLQNVDGIVSHSIELQSAKKFYGNIKARKLFFPNYTDNDNFFDKEACRLSLNDIHIVYVGGIMSAYRNKDYFGGSQLHWLVEKLNKQKIHFHIYPSPSLLKEHIIDFVEYDKNLEYFHLHQSVSQSELSTELAQYDFGILPFFHRTNKRLDDKRFYSTTLKMFNYFEAGLPIIIGKDVLFQNYMGRKYQGGIMAEWEDLDDIRALIKNYDYVKLIDLIKKNREYLSLKNQIIKLSSFYYQL